MRLGQEGLILKQRIAVAGPTRADGRLDWELRASLARPHGKVQVLWRWVWLRTRDISRMQYSTASTGGSCAPTAQVQIQGEIRVTATACDSHRGVRAADATLQYVTMTWYTRCHEVP